MCLGPALQLDKAGRSHLEQSGLGLGGGRELWKQGWKESFYVGGHRQSATRSMDQMSDAKCKVNSKMKK